jgi:hypothetical protein
MKLQDTIDLVQIQATSSNSEVEALCVAVGYLDPDGTQKLCGDRCIFHFESGKYKDRCALLGQDVVVPNVASCTYYAKGDPVEKWQDPDVKPEKIFTPEEVGLISGKVQCKRCIRKGSVDGVCAALTSVLRKVLGVKQDFKIDGDGCCNWNKAKGQKVIK